MSDSGFPQFPPGGSGNGPRDLANIPGVRRGSEIQPDTGQRVRIIGVPDDLRKVEQNVRIRGEVVGENRDGSLRLRTQSGDIDIRIPNRQTSPPQGQLVEIEIRPGNPPTQAVIREHANVEPRHALPPQTQPQNPDIRPVQTPVSLEVRPPAAPVAPTQRQHEPLQPQDVVRLLPLAANLADDIIRPIIEQIRSSITVQLETSAQIIIRETQPSQIINQINTTAQPPAIIEQISLLSLSQSTTAVRSSLPLSPLLQNILTDFPAHNIPLAVPEASFTPPQRSFLTVQVPDLLSRDIPTPPPAAVIPSTAFQPFEARIAAIIPPATELVLPGHEPRNIMPAAALTEPGNPVSNTAHIIGFIQQSQTQTLPVISLALPSDNVATPLFVIQVPGSMLPVGTQIQLIPQTPLPTITSASLPPLTAAIPAAFLSPEPTWPVLQQIYQALTQISPQAAQALSNITPQAANPAQLGPAALFFLAAVRSGDITSWLGDKAADILRRDGKGNLLTRLTQEGSILNRLGAEPVSQDWRGLSIPHFWEGQMHKMTLYYKNDDGGNEQENGRQTRFIFDLSLTNLGKVQLDGLFRRTRLDLVVRTENRFSSAMQAEMKRTYTGALGQTHLTGDLSFQNRPDQWVRINPIEQTLGVTA